MPRTYSPRKVLVFVGGQPISGFAPDSFIKVERAEDSFETDVGADGEVARVAKANRSGTVTITLQSVSASNDFLSDLIMQDELTQDATVSFSVVDASGRTVVQAPEVWVQKPPAVEFSGSKGTREWVLASGNLIFDKVGGN